MKWQDRMNCILFMNYERSVLRLINKRKRSQALKRIGCRFAFGCLHISNGNFSVKTDTLILQCNKWFPISHISLAYNSTIRKNYSVIMPKLKDGGRESIIINEMFENRYLNTLRQQLLVLTLGLEKIWQGRIVLNKTGLLSLP